MNTLPQVLGYKNNILSTKIEMNKLTYDQIRILIKEVKKRSCLYKRMHPRYREKLYTKAMWEDVAEEVFNQNWSKYNEQKRKDKVKEVVKIWRRLRAYFTKDLNNEARNQLSNKTFLKRFRFFDDLLFLKPHIELKYFGGSSRRDAEKSRKVSTAEILKLDVEKAITLDDTATSHPQEKTLKECTVVIYPLQVKVSTERTNPVREDLSKLIVNDKNLPIRPAASEYTQSVQVIKKPTVPPSKVKILGPICEKVVESAEANTSPSLNDKNLALNKNIERQGPVRKTSVKQKNNVERNSRETENTECTVNDIDWSHFALSLVPMFNMVPMEKSQQVQIEILATLNNLYIQNIWRERVTQDGGSNVMDTSDSEIINVINSSDEEDVIFVN